MATTSEVTTILVPSRFIFHTPEWARVTRSVGDAAPLMDALPTSYIKFATLGRTTISVSVALIDWLCMERSKEWLIRLKRTVSSDIPMRVLPYGNAVKHRSPGSPHGGAPRVTRHVCRLR